MEFGRKWKIIVKLYQAGDTRIPLLRINRCGHHKKLSIAKLDFVQVCGLSLSFYNNTLRKFYKFCDSRETNKSNFAIGWLTNQQTISPASNAQKSVLSWSISLSRILDTPIAFDERVTFFGFDAPGHCLVRACLPHCMRVWLRNGYTQAYAQIIQHTQTQKAVMTCWSQNVTLRPQCNSRTVILGGTVTGDRKFWRDNSNKIILRTYQFVPKRTSIIFLRKLIKKRHIFDMHTTCARLVQLSVCRRDS